MFSSLNSSFDFIWLLVDGQWGPWGGYGSCSKTCNSGQKVRTRKCNSPSPSHGGKGCIGSKRQKKRCNTKGCPCNVLSYFTLLFQYIFFYLSTTASLIKFFIIQDPECGSFGSRDWNYGCSDFCDCNKDDGGKKDKCGYCCYCDKNGYCHRKLPLSRTIRMIYQNDSL